MKVWGGVAKQSAGWLESIHGRLGERRKTLQMGTVGSVFRISRWKVLSSCSIPNGGGGGGK